MCTPAQKQFHRSFKITHHLHYLCWIVTPAPCPHEHGTDHEGEHDEVGCSEEQKSAVSNTPIVHAYICQAIFCIMYC